MKKTIQVTDKQPAKKIAKKKEISVNPLEGLLGILLGMYLILVVVKGKTEDLIKFLKDNKAFGKYLIAWICLYGIYRLSYSQNEFLKAIGSIVELGIPLFVIGYLLYQYENVKQELDKLLKKFS
ncbi:MAG: hypothetical protein RMJ67_08900 [Elusimicrobiota bacterium]|nr:hypothetical protein [Endomicrobiia bacterium]MDW8166614.1 hypothetical protein [Elusimicrobiota bacterium]